MCSSPDLKTFLDLGFTPLADAFLSKERLNQPEVHYPLKVYSCQNCGYAQLSYVVPGEELYCKGYPYESSTTVTGRKHFYDMAASIVERFELGNDAVAMDIGSNVGVLLAGFKEAGTQVLGVDPAEDMVRKANLNGIETINGFFTENLAEEIASHKGQVDVITATNSFAHMPDAEEFVKAADKLLKSRGVIAIEAPYFVDLLDHLEYDTIYHEHLGYLAVRPLTFLFERSGMEIFDVVRTKIHGGSIRVFVARKGDHPVSDYVKELVDLEHEKGLYSMEKLQDFAQKVEAHKKDLFSLLRKLKKEGKRIVGVSAPAKGNTLLNYCHITTDILDFITEKAQIKVDMFTPGTHIPIYDDSRLLEEMPDYALILAWNFAEEIMKNLEEFRNKGGKFIIPIPNPTIL